MSGIIVALPKLEDAKRIHEMLSHHGFEVTAVCTTAAAVLSKANEIGSGVVVCTRRFPDRYYAQLAEDLPEYVEMILLSVNPEADSDAKNVTMLQMPFKPSELTNLVDAKLTEIHRRIKRQRVGPVKRSKEEQMEIDKAKQLLMEKKHMTEQEAFRYIQKTSMDSGSSMVETAQKILILNSE